MLRPGSAFVKQGAGTLTVHHYPGYNTGSVNGTIVASNGSHIGFRMGSAFTGTVEIPADVTFERTAAMKATSYVGAGTYILPTSADVPPAGFAGTVATSPGAALNADGGNVTAPAAIELADGSSLTLPAAYVTRYGRERARPDWNVAGAWALSGRDVGATSDNPPTISEGVLVLTDAAGSQRRGAWLADDAFRADSIWQASFTYTATPDASGGQVAGERRCRLHRRRLAARRAHVPHRRPPRGQRRQQDAPLPTPRLPHPL